MKRSTLLLVMIGICLLLVTMATMVGWYLGMHAKPISRSEAVAIAFGQAGTGDVQLCRLTRWNGKIVWNIEFTQRGKRGVTEARIHAITGEWLGMQEESRQKSDEELTKLAKDLGITAAHVMPAKPGAKSNPGELPSLRDGAAGGSK